MLSEKEPMLGRTENGPGNIVEPESLPGKPLQKLGPFTRRENTLETNLEKCSDALEATSLTSLVEILGLNDFMFVKFRLADLWPKPLARPWQISAGFSV